MCSETSSSMWEDNGLVPIGCQAIFLTNVTLIWSEIFWEKQYLIKIVHVTWQPLLELLKFYASFSQVTGIDLKVGYP